MRIKIDETYKEYISDIAKSLKGYTFLLDIQSVSEFEFELNDGFMRVKLHSTDGGAIVNYPYEKLKYCDVRSNGYALLLRDKSFLFLPVTADKVSNDELLRIGVMLKEIYDGLHFVVKEPLLIEMQDDRRRSEKMQRRRGETAFANPAAMIVIGIVFVCVATFFMIMRSAYAFVGEDECERFVGVFVKIRENSSGYNYLYLESGEKFRIHQACRSEEFYERILALEKGETVELKVNPKNGYTVALRTSDSEILNFETALTEMRSDAEGFMWIALFVYAAAGLIITHGLRRLKKERI